MLRIGLIGYGGFGRFLHHSWEAGGVARITAIADERAIDPPPGEVRVFSDWKELVSCNQVDLVAIATPPNTHAEIACHAMSGGKHVLIEKPLALTEPEARQVIETRDATGTVAGVDFMLRFNPLVEWISERCADATFGELRRIAVENHAQDESLGPDHWFWNPKISGGILVEHAVHFIDLANAWTRAKPVEITGLNARRADGRMDRMFAAIKHESGAISSHYHAFSRPNFFEKTTISLTFDLADIRLDGWIPLEGRIDALVNERSEAAVRILPGFEVATFESIPGGGPATTLHSGGIAYAVTHRLAGSFRIGVPKSDVYATCLCSLLRDLSASVHNSGHRQRVTLEDGLISLLAAIAATHHFDR